MIELAIAEMASLYPKRKEVWQTSDGLLHLTKEEAEAQARHLEDTTILTHSLKAYKK